MYTFNTWAIESIHSTVIYIQYNIYNVWGKIKDSTKFCHVQRIDQFISVKVMVGPKMNKPETGKTSNLKIFVFIPNIG